MDTKVQIEIADEFVGKIGNELPSQHLHGRGRGEGLGSGVDSVLNDIDYDDALRRISELPPSERKAALREWKKSRKGAR